MSSLSKKLSTKMKANSPTKSPSIDTLRKGIEINLERFAASVKKRDKLQTYNINQEVSIPSGFVTGDQGSNSTQLGDEANLKCNKTEKRKRKTTFTSTENVVGISEHGQETPPEQATSSLNDTSPDNEEQTASTEADDKSDSEGSEAELPTFRNSIDKTFYLDLTDEVKDYVKELSARFVDDKQKNPTVAEMKYIGQKALGVLLRYNDRGVPKGVTKDEVAKTVHDHMQHGVPPRCPKCKRGSLRFSNGKKKAGKRYYWCPGSTTNGRAFYGCNFKAQKHEIQREPWKNPD